MKLGNNKWGSKGCVKCDECRRRKTKCVYNTNAPHEACRDCKKRNATCGKTLPIQPGKMSGSDYSSSPTPSDTSSFHTGMSPARSVDTPRPAIVNTNLASELLGYASDYALQLEHDFPSSPPRKIISYIREYFERGDFGDLRFLLSLPVSHSTPNPPSQQRRQSVSTAFAPFEATTYPPSVPFPSRPHSGTVNPATLSMPLMLPIPYSYTEDLQRADDIDSDSTAPPEQPGPYNYMSISSVGLGHEDRDFAATQPRYISGEPYVNYGP